MKASEIRKLKEQNKRLKEEVEILKDTKLMREISESLEEIRRGNYITL